MIRLALSDMDNTLIPFGAPHVSDRTLAAIAGVRAAGVEFGPSTGRDCQELMRFFQGDASAFRTGIMSSGKKVMVDGELVSVTYIDHDGLQRVADVLADVPGIFLVAYPAETDETNPVWTIAAAPDQVPPFAERFRFTYRFADRVPDEPMIAATLAMAGGEGCARFVEEALAPAFPEFSFVSPTPGWFDIVPRGVSKASGLAILLDALGLASDEVAVFGDSDNDIQVMEKVPASVAVANATPEVAALARYHIGACADDAVASALDDIAQAAREGRMPRFMEQER